MYECLCNTGGSKGPQKPAQLCRQQAFPHLLCDQGCVLVQERSGINVYYHPLCDSVWLSEFWVGSALANCVTLYVS